MAKKPTHQRYPFSLRSLSLLLAFSFLLTDISYAAQLEPISLYSPKPLEALSLDPTRFEPPLDFSLLKEIHKGTSPTFIIHIQDAHSNLSGQENLAKTLDEIIKKYGVSLILVEAGSPIDGSLAPLKKITTREMTQTAAKSLLLQGRIAGEEYLSLVSDSHMKLRGVEDMALYMKSVKCYGALAGKRESILAYLKSIQSAVDKLKNKMYPQSLLAYEKEKEAKGSGFSESNFKGLLNLLSRHPMDLKNFPNVRALQVLQDKEKSIDFNLANLEQAALVAEITQKGGGQAVKNYLEEMSRAKNQRASQFSQFQNIFNISKEKNIFLEKYPNLLKYGEYLKDFAELDLDKLLDELTQVEDQLYVSILAKSMDARLVRSIDRYLSLLNTAYRIQMSSGDFKFFEVNEPDFATASYLAFINRKLADLGYFQDLIPYRNILEEGKKSLEAFYGSVDERDMAFIKNTQNILREENQKVAVLITGGYHSQHLKQLFREKDYSYAVLAPIVTSETNQKRYEKLLLSLFQDEHKKVEVVQGENKTDKPLSLLEEDMLKAKGKTDGVRILRYVAWPDCFNAFVSQVRTKEATAAATRAYFDGIYAAEHEAMLQGAERLANTKIPSKEIPAIFNPQPSIVSKAAKNASKGSRSNTLAKTSTPAARLANALEIISTLKSPDALDALEVLAMNRNNKGFVSSVLRGELREFFHVDSLSDLYKEFEVLGREKVIQAIQQRRKQLNSKNLTSEPPGQKQMGFLRKNLLWFGVLGATALWVIAIIHSGLGYDLTTKTIIRETTTPELWGQSKMTESYILREARWQRIPGRDRVLITKYYAAEEDLDDDGQADAVEFYDPSLKTIFSITDKGTFWGRTQYDGFGNYMVATQVLLFKDSNNQWDVFGQSLGSVKDLSPESRRFLKEQGFNFPIKRHKKIQAPNKKGAAPVFNMGRGARLASEQAGVQEREFYDAEAERVVRKVIEGVLYSASERYPVGYLDLRHKLEQTDGDENARFTALYLQTKFYGEAVEALLLKTDEQFKLAEGLSREALMVPETDETQALRRRCDLVRNEMEAKQREIIELSRGLAGAADAAVERNLQIIASGGAVERPSDAVSTKHALISLLLAASSQRLARSLEAVALANEIDRLNSIGKDPLLVNLRQSLVALMLSVDGISDEAELSTGQRNDLRSAHIHLRRAIDFVDKGKVRLLGGSLRSIGLFFNSLRRSRPLREQIPILDLEHIQNLYARGFFNSQPKLSVSLHLVMASRCLEDVMRQLEIVGIHNDTLLQGIILSVNTALLDLNIGTEDLEQQKSKLYTDVDTIVAKLNQWKSLRIKDPLKGAIVERILNGDVSDFLRAIDHLNELLDLCSGARMAITNITTLIQTYLPAEFHPKFTVANHPVQAHREGPLLTDHLQALLNVLNDPAAYPDIPERYRKILLDPANRLFFEQFILLHDLAKTTMTPTEKIEEGHTYQLYAGHEAESAKMMEEDPRLAQGLENRLELMEVVKLHGALYGISREVPTMDQFEAFMSQIDPKADKKQVLEFLIAADFLDTLATLRDDPWPIRVRNFAQTFEEWEKSAARLASKSSYRAQLGSVLETSPHQLAEYFKKIRNSTVRLVVGTFDENNKNKYEVVRGSGVVVERKEDKAYVATVKHALFDKIDSDGRLPKVLSHQEVYDRREKLYPYVKIADDYGVIDNQSSRLKGRVHALYGQSGLALDPQNRLIPYDKLLGNELLLGNSETSYWLTFGFPEDDFLRIWAYYPGAEIKSPFGYHSVRLDGFNLESGRRAIEPYIRYMSDPGGISGGGIFDLETMALIGVVDAGTIVKTPPTLYGEPIQKSLIEHMMDTGGVVPKFGARLASTKSDLVMAVAIQGHGGPWDFVNRLISFGSAITTAEALSRGSLSSKDLLPVTRTLEELDAIADRYRAVNSDTKNIKEDISASGKPNYFEIRGRYMSLLKQVHFVYLKLYSQFNQLALKSGYLKECFPRRIEPQIKRLIFQNRALLYFVDPTAKKRDQIQIVPWLRGRLWQTKQVSAFEKFEVISDAHDSDFQIKANPELLHVLIERLISNELHAEFDIKEDPASQDLLIQGSALRINVRRVKKRSGSRVEISIPNLFYTPTSDIESKIEALNASRELNYQRRSFEHGIGLAFATSAMRKMGGNLFFRASRDYSQDPGKSVIEVVIRFPEDQASPKRRSLAANAPEAALATNGARLGEDLNPVIDRWLEFGSKIIRQDEINPEAYLYAHILALLEKYFPQGFSGLKGLELGPTQDSIALFQYLQDQGADMTGLGYEAPIGSGFITGEIGGYLADRDNDFDFIYDWKVLTRMSANRVNTLERLREIYRALHKNLKNSGILITTDDTATESHVSDQEIESLGFQVLGRGMRESLNVAVWKKVNPAARLAIHELYGESDKTAIERISPDTDLFLDDIQSINYEVLSVAKEDLALQLLGKMEAFFEFINGYTDQESQRYKYSALFRSRGLMILGDALSRWPHEWYGLDFEYASDLGDYPRYYRRLFPRILSLAQKIRDAFPGKTAIDDAVKSRQIDLEGQPYLVLDTLDTWEKIQRVVDKLERLGVRPSGARLENLAKYRKSFNVGELNELYTSLRKNRLRLDTRARVPDLGIARSKRLSVLALVLEFGKDRNLKQGAMRELEEDFRANPKQIAQVASLLMFSLEKDKDPEVRINAVFHLGRIRPRQPSVIKKIGRALIGALKDKNDIVRDQAARSMTYVPAIISNTLFLNQVLNFWAERLTHRNPKIRESAARGLAVIGRTASPALPSLARRLKDRDFKVRDAAIHALVDIDASYAASALIQNIGEPLLDSHALALSLQNISEKIGSIEIEDGLRAVIKNNNKPPDIRQKAGGVLRDFLIKEEQKLEASRLMHSPARLAKIELSVKRLETIYRGIMTVAQIPIARYFSPFLDTAVRTYWDELTSLASSGGYASFDDATADLELLFSLNQPGAMTRISRTAPEAQRILRAKEIWPTIAGFLTDTTSYQSAFGRHEEVDGFYSDFRTSIKKIVAARQGTDTIRILVAGPGFYQEPIELYLLTVDEILKAGKNPEQFNIVVRVLDKRRENVLFEKFGKNQIYYGSKDMAVLKRLVGDRINLEDYFDESERGFYPKTSLRQKLEQINFNLENEDLRTVLNPSSPEDVVMMMNVADYIDPSALPRIYAALYPFLRPGGVLYSNNFNRLTGNSQLPSEMTAQLPAIARTGIFHKGISPARLASQAGSATAETNFLTTQFLPVLKVALSDLFSFFGYEIPDLSDSNFSFKKSYVLMANIREKGLLAEADLLQSGDFYVPSRDKHPDDRALESISSNVVFGLMPYQQRNIELTIHDALYDHRWGAIFALTGMQSFQGYPESDNDLLALSFSYLAHCGMIAVIDPNLIGGENKQSLQSGQAHVNDVDRRAYEVFFHESISYGAIREFLVPEEYAKAAIKIFGSEKVKIIPSVRRNMAVPNRDGGYQHVDTTIPDYESYIAKALAQNPSKNYLFHAIRLPGPELVFPKTSVRIKIQVPAKNLNPADLSRALRPALLSGSLIRLLQLDSEQADRESIVARLKELLAQSTIQLTKAERVEVEAVINEQEPKEDEPQRQYKSLAQLERERQEAEIEALVALGHNRKYLIAKKREMSSGSAWVPKKGARLAQSKEAPQRILPTNHARHFPAQLATRGEELQPIFGVLPLLAGSEGEMMGAAIPFQISPARLAGLKFKRANDGIDGWLVNPKTGAIYEKAGHFTPEQIRQAAARIAVVRAMTAKSATFTDYNVQTAKTKINSLNTASIERLRSAAKGLSKHTEIVLQIVTTGQDARSIADSVRNLRSILKEADFNKLHVYFQFVDGELNPDTRFKSDAPPTTSLPIMVLGSINKQAFEKLRSFAGLAGTKPGLLLMQEAIHKGSSEVDVPPYYASMVDAIFVKIANSEDAYRQSAQLLSRLTGISVGIDDAQMVQEIPSDAQFFRYQKIMVLAITRVSVEIYRDILSAVAVGSAA